MISFQIKGRAEAGLIFFNLVCLLLIDIFFYLVRWLYIELQAGNHNYQGTLIIDLLKQTNLMGLALGVLQFFLPPHAAQMLYRIAPKRVCLQDYPALGLV